MEAETALSGMKEIMEHCNQIGLPRTEASIIQLKKCWGFPMTKIMGVWESDKELIAIWRKKYVAGEITFDTKNDSGGKPYKIPPKGRENKTKSGQ